MSRLRPSYTSNQKQSMECRVRGLAETFAMKIVDNSKLQGRGHMIQNEVALLRSLEHPRLIQLLFDEKDWLVSTCHYSLNSHREWIPPFSSTRIWVRLPVH
uniref:Protein kinase domain-containing protein n=1 Tax=Sinocyclocheilus grahami TaxID=75366 RepID=A0A672RP52_SINGR